jgi:hypothetical protein
MKKNYLPILLFLSGTLAAGLSFAASADYIPNIDRTCSNCSRRYLDSLNVYARPAIRVNQVGFRPADAHKYAFVADTKATTFDVINASSGKSVWNGTLASVGNWPRPNMWVNGAFNSITSVYEFGDTTSASTEKLYSADFSSLSTPGEYYLVVGKDTSAHFIINDYLFNAVFETTLKFFGIQRCGDTHSQLHKPCHLKDGSAVGHDLTGGWHDCGDHFKASETEGYAALVLSLAYDVYSEKAEDRYGQSYDDTTTTDGIPDVLWEAKTGVDFIYKLYKASKEDGLIDQGDMYHSVGVGSADHQYWDVPEKQDVQSTAKGGAPRPVAKGIGTNVAGMYAATMAFFAAGWEMYQTDHYSDSLIAAAKDMYAKIVAPSFLSGTGCSTKGKQTDNLLGFYPGAGPCNDDAAAAALALWYATKDTSYAYDLYKNKTINDNAENYKWNLPYFRAGYMGHTSGFYPGGWMTDYENVHAYVLFAFDKLILPTVAKAQSYGISSAERDTLLTRIIATMYRLTDDGTEGDSTVSTNSYGSFRVTPPYNLVWTSSDWGFNRYNMGAANAVFMLYDMTGETQYLNVALDNFYYNMGENPWGISFIMGAGSRNENHPHNRAANPDGYNAGGMPYEYKCPKGALMGGSAPTKTLKDDWNDYTATETCIDFSAQFIIPGLSLSKNVPEDVDGPLFSNIQGTPISDTSAVISWNTDERAIVTVYYSKTPDAATADSVTASAGVGGSVTIGGLTQGVTYYFYLVGYDVKKNVTTDDNHGKWYSFTMTNGTATISGLTICQVTNNSAKIYWWTKDAASNTIVRYGTSASSLSTSTTGDAGFFHAVTLTGLTAGTTYYFDAISGTTTDNNSGKHYSFTTSAQASYADFSVFIKPSSYQSACTDWKTCNTLIISVTNNDTTAYEDAELRLYLKTNNLNPVSYIKSVWDGTGTSMQSGDITFSTPVDDGTGSGYYLPITLKGTFAVSGQYLFQLKFQNATFGDLDGSWSLRAHTASTDPVQFAGIDLTKGPAYSGSETTYLETVNGVKEVAFTKDPYVAIYYNGKHIYGYDPTYDPTTSDLSIDRTVALNFTSPFTTQLPDTEQVAYAAKYAGSGSVSPTGYLDAFEANGIGKTFSYKNTSRYDSINFSIDTTLAYGNNRIDWVLWHNRNANASGSYDCACDVVRSNVEVDTITTPLEKRILVFVPSDSVGAYIGKRGSVHIKLTDSTGAIVTGEDFSVSLSTLAGTVQFYTSSTATVAVTGVTLSNGEADIYFSGSAAVATTLIGSATGGSSKYSYTSAKVKLSIEDLPPWPIIGAAVMLDTNCDFVPDAVQITLSSPYLEGQSFNSAKIVYDGDTVTSTSATLKDSLTLLVAFAPTNTAVNTNPSGSITLVSNVSGATQSSTDTYADGIGPMLSSISVLERLPGATVDKVYLQFSEPIAAPGIIWPVNLYSNGTAVTEPTVITSKLYNDARNIWEFDIQIPADSSSPVSAGMTAQLKTTATIADKSGNPVSTLCAQPLHTVTLKILPVALVHASISDKNGDGLAENVYVLFERAVDATHAPDSISVVFGSAAPETLTTASYTWSDDRTSAVLNLAKPFSLGNTNGTYSGIYQGSTLTGAGLVTQHKGAGANYESDSTLAEDLAGPVIIGGVIKQSGKIYALTATASEPITSRGNSLPSIQRERKGPVTLEAESEKFQTAAISFFYQSGAPGEVKEGDRIRFTPQELSSLTDASGNLPAANNPWATVTGSGEPKIDFSFRLKDNVTQVSAQNVSENAGDEDFRVYILNAQTAAWDLVDKDGKVISSTDTASMTFGGAIFKIDMGVPRGASLQESPAWDSLFIRYDIPIYTNLGGYVNRIKGKLTALPTDLSSDNTVALRIEWVNHANSGLSAENGKAIGTGAYIAKASVKARYAPDFKQDAATVRRFTYSDSYSVTRTFGIQRTKK